MASATAEHEDAVAPTLESAPRESFRLSNRLDHHGPAPPPPRRGASAARTAACKPLEKHIPVKVATWHETSNRSGGPRSALCRVVPTSFALQWFSGRQSRI